MKLDEQRNEHRNFLNYRYIKVGDTMIKVHCFLKEKQGRHARTWEPLEITFPSARVTNLKMETTRTPRSYELLLESTPNKPAAVQITNQCSLSTLITVVAVAVAIVALVVSGVALHRANVAEDRASRLEEEQVAALTQASPVDLASHHFTATSTLSTVAGATSLISSHPFCTNQSSPTNLQNCLDLVATVTRFVSSPSFTSDVQNAASAFQQLTANSLLFTSLNGTVISSNQTVVTQDPELVSQMLQPANCELYFDSNMCMFALPKNNYIVILLGDVRTDVTRRSLASWLHAVAQFLGKKLDQDL